MAHFLVTSFKLSFFICSLPCGSQFMPTCNLVSLLGSHNITNTFCLTQLLISMFLNIMTVNTFLEISDIMDKEENLKEIQQCECNKSIPTIRYTQKISKGNADIFSEVLRLSFNSQLSKEPGVFPSVFKMADVSLIFKKVRQTLKIFIDQSAFLKPRQTYLKKLCIRTWVSSLLQIAKYFCKCFCKFTFAIYKYVCKLQCGCKATLKKPSAHTSHSVG